MVEVLTRLGQVRWRQRLTHFPATLGRALSCDVILEEADVSAEHARVVKADDGSLVLEDLKSRNGVRFRRKRVDRLPLGERTEVKLGSSRVRFVSLDARPEKTVLLQISRLDRLSSVLLALGAVAASAVVTEGLLSATKHRSSEVVTSYLVIVMVAGGWAFAWALATRVAQGHFRFLGHFAAALMMLFALALVNRLPQFLAFVLRLSQGVEWALMVAMTAGAGAWMLWHHLVRVTSWTERRAALVAGGLVLVGVGLASLERASAAQKYSVLLPLQGRAHPPIFLIGSADPVASLTDALPKLQEQVDQLRTEP